MSNPEKNPQALGDFPPPPPGPPPYQQFDHQQPPPQEKQSQPQPQNEQQSQQLPKENAPHPHPLGANPVHLVEQPTTQQNYEIPPYNPAAPVFAPPPTTETVQPGSVTTPAATAPAATNDPGHKKPGWSERFTQLGQKAAAPINNLANKLGSQAFLPQTLDKECEKAAVILKAFCKKGVYADPAADQPPTSTDPKATETAGEGIIDPTKEKPKNRVIVTIPPKVISKAVGLAIFTTLRAGFHVSGATGSGVLVARLPDGSWSPPSGIQVHSVGGGFSIGLDIYDCVCVINSKEALAAFTNTRVSLGSDLAVVAGPYGAGGAVEFGAAMDSSKEKGKKKAEDTEPAPPAEPSRTSEDKQSLKPEQPEGKGQRRSPSASRMKPVFSYVKSRGFYAGIQVDGTVVVERKDANAAFYGEKVPVDKILKGEVPAQGPSGMWPTGARGLLEILKGAEAGALKDGKEATSSTPIADPSHATTATQGSGDPAGPPAYVDDGVRRPEVGDFKYR